MRHAGGAPYGADAHSGRGCRLDTGALPEELAYRGGGISGEIDRAGPNSAHGVSATGKAAETTDFNAGCAAPNGACAQGAVQSGAEQSLVLPLSPQPLQSPGDALAAAPADLAQVFAFTAVQPRDSAATRSRARTRRNILRGLDSSFDTNCYQGFVNNLTSINATCHAHLTVAQSKSVAHVCCAPPEG